MSTRTRQVRSQPKGVAETQGLSDSCLEVMSNNRCILVVDDSEADISILNRAILKAGIDSRVVSMRDGQEAVDYLSNESGFNERTHPMPDLMLLDLKMPKMDGFDVLTWLQNQPRLKRLPVMVLSSSQQDRDVDRAYDLGANCYVLKPSSLAGYAEIAKGLREFWMELNRCPNCQPK
jgi:CheY-like chemotaxis protein